MEICRQSQSFRSLPKVAGRAPGNRKMHPLSQAVVRRPVLVLRFTDQPIDKNRRGLRECGDDGGGDFQNKVVFGTADINALKRIVNAVEVKAFAVARTRINIEAALIDALVDFLRIAQDAADLFSFKGGGSGGTV